MSDETLNIIVGFGGVAVLALIGVVVWFLTAPKDGKGTPESRLSDRRAARGPTA